MLYEYLCESCGFITEEQRKMEHRNEPKDCEKCGKPMRLVISKTSFQLKGQGWYATDYKSKEKKADE